MKHLIKVTNDVISIANKHGINPVELALSKELNIEKVVVDRKFILFYDNVAGYVGVTKPRIFRSPASVEAFTYKHYVGQEVEAFEFEI